MPMRTIEIASRPLGAMMAAAAAAAVVAGCSMMRHPVVLDAGASATFDAGRLNGQPVAVERWQAEGVTFVLEHSVFVYDLSPPAYHWQYLGSVSPADDAPWTPTREDLTTFTNAFVDRMFTRPVIDGLASLAVTCAPPADDLRATELAPTIATECRNTAGTTAYNARIRVASGARGIIVQAATHGTGNAKGKQFVDSFFASLRLDAPAPAPARDDAARRRYPVRFMGERAASVFDKK
jgi:hypothetical protein